jgi:hypothetical protein
VTTGWNPFLSWGELARGLRDRFVAELDLKGPAEMTPHCAEFVGTLAGLITTIDHLGKRLEGMARNEPRAYEAFVCAMEKTP